MAIKESSDELNPTAVVSAPASTPRPARTGKDYLALALGTCGVGYMPGAPGTFGSIVGVLLFVAVRGGLLLILWPLADRHQLNLLHITYAMIAGLLLVAVIVTLIGTWAAGRVEKLHGAKDPQKVVIDEVAGQFIAFMAVPLEIDKWWSMILAFLLFRFFDIVKPYPARNFENLHGGLGIMADDVVAGIYAATGVALVVSIQTFR